MIRNILVVVVGLSLVGSAALAQDDGGATVIDALEVTAEAGALTVTGAVSYGSVEHFLVGDRGTPATLGEVGQELGGYIEEAFLAQPDPVSGDLVFNFLMRDIEFSQVPELVQYYWDFRLQQPDGTVATFSLGGRGARATTGGAPSFTLDGNCVQTQNLIECESFGAVPSELDADARTVRITVPAELMDAQGVNLDGARVLAADVRGGIAAQPSQVAVNMFAFQYNVRHRHNYTVGRHVTVALDDGAGTTTVPAALLDEDGFTATFPDVPAGEHTLTTTACFGSDCATDTRQVVVD
jgi:hypothetical protein